ncbi:hypothetical protein E2C01_021179 [Portunus trituberculatus]|uniref:Uncharacterized protein n=1 Tax=Portunus trituberculatus TaxID=210409 RepID=A0A5B7E3Q9_PORTR|nr:hypothetical protein [Portunus trituberculatus]
MVCVFQLTGCPPIHIPSPCHLLAFPTHTLCLYHPYTFFTSISANLYTHSRLLWSLNLRRTTLEEEEVAEDGMQRR